MGASQSKKNQQAQQVQTQHTPLREERSQSLHSSSTPIPVKRQSSTPVVSLTMKRKTSLFTAKSASPPPTRVQSATRNSPIVSAAPECRNEDDLIIGTPPKKRNRSFSMPYKVVPLNVSSEESMWRELRNANNGEMPTRCQSAHSMPQSPILPTSPTSPEGRLLRRLSKAHSKSEQDLPSILVTPPKEISNLEHLSPSQRKKCLAKSPTVLSGLKTPYIIETGENLPKSPIFAKGVLINA
ncbi:predicted protein [Naegleria gruberi]|uniref:Predicted protein n=1 Tax=Naegleria gruberi TaxID=5762 RepID=D2VRN4_NAEGR|nr:uncharacterized protein NAEGRDRAFT_71647 [Naegleria gruberi]EFC40423.1 predicted protein [Naegleria gruberi]|eukprot:XP_002673167.1 predicted protein [Naegleria gruberi strain NEG-M]